MNKIVIYIYILLACCVTSCAQRDEERKIRHNEDGTEKISARRTNGVVLATTETITGIVMMVQKVMITQKIVNTLII